MSGGISDHSVMHFARHRRKVLNWFDLNLGRENYLLLSPEIHLDTIENFSENLSINEGEFKQSSDFLLERRHGTVAVF